MKPIVEWLCDQPYLVCVVRCDPTPAGLNPREISKHLFSEVVVPLAERGATEFRGTELSRLSVVLRNGIDVTPSNSVFYCADFEKALEYGGWPKMVLALDNKNLSNTFVEISADANESELASLRGTYPTVLKASDGTTFWCSRLRATDAQIATDYEVAYARWIPGDPMRALKGIALFCASDDQDSYRIIRSRFSPRSH